MTQPERTVTNNLLVSTAMPAIKVRVAKEFDYLGRLEFILYGVASVELFAFVADSDWEAWRFLIVQFEHYLDSNSHTYNYPLVEGATLGEHEYVLDTFVGPTSDDLENAESDSARTLRFIQEAGFSIPEEVVTTRFVRLLDSSKRSEILFSYNENLGNLGYKATEVADDYRPKPEYSSLARKQLESAMGAFKVLEG